MSGESMSHAIHKVVGARRLTRCQVALEPLAWFVEEI
jgi:hypothetical protein